MSRAPARKRAFTLFEVMLAVALTLVLMFGALYTTSETVAVVREGDRRVHTHVQARRALDRLLKDCRHASALAVQGSEDDGWTITLTPTGTLDPPSLTYAWNPVTGELRVTDGNLESLVVEGLRSFTVQTETVDTGNGPQISRIALQWILDVLAGSEAGAGAATYPLSLGGATWVRQNAPSF